MNSFLILTHKNIDHIYELASKMSDSNFYIHLDLKVKLNSINKSESDISNIYFVDNRVDVKWAGFSMVQATLNMFEYALSHDPRNEFFHLISGDDVLLSRQLNWSGSDIYMECKESKEHRYRMRFDTPHSDTKYQRKFLGKALTQFYKKLDKLLPTKKKYYSGSQWFSIRRKQLEIIMSSIEESDMDFFKKKLCPDEHFFQYLVVKCDLLTKISEYGNKRFIKFNPSFQRGSSPIFLNSAQLLLAKNQEYWFARKVEPIEMQKFYLMLDDV